MNAFSRRGACPALSAPMQTGDGLLVRLNPIAGGLSPKALIGLCKAALRHGNGIVEITARGSLQIRGLTVSSAPLFAAEVDALGIAVRTGVPVETGPLAGLDPDEIADPTGLAESIRTAIDAAGLSSRLGPKVSVVVDGGGRSGMDDVVADVRLTSVRKGVVVSWQLAIAGDAESARQLDGLGTSPVAAVISILEAIAELGLEGRARSLPSPLLSRGGCQGEVIHKGEVKASAFFPLTDSRVALRVALPFGHTQGQTLIAFAQAAEALRGSDIRPAPQRAFFVLCPDETAAKSILAVAGELGFVIDPFDPRSHIAACPGKPACASGHIASRDLAAEIARDYSEILDGSFELHISGCAKGCAHPGASALTLVGSENGAGIVVGGMAKDLPSAYTPSQDTIRAFGRIAGLVRQERRGSETAAATLRRLCPERLAEVFEKQ